MKGEQACLRGVFQLSRAGVVVAEGAAGRVDDGTGERCRLETRFQGASISKQFVAASVMVLSERGVLSVEDPVSRWWSAAPPEWEPMTVGHLLSHTSGLGGWLDIPGIDISRPPPAVELLDRAAGLPLMSRPGTCWRYSGAGYVLAAAIVEAASDQSYGAFVTDTIFGPLGMTATTSGRRPELSGVAIGYRGGEPAPPVAELIGLVGTGDLWTTVVDLVRYVEAVSAGELLSQGSWELMRRPHAEVHQPPTDGETISASGYGYGLFIGSIAGQPAWFHPGDNPGYRSFLARLPKTDTTLAVLSNEESLALDDLVPQLLRGIRGSR